MIMKMALSVIDGVWALRYGVVSFQGVTGAPRRYTHDISCFTR